MTECAPLQSRGDPGIQLLLGPGSRNKAEVDVKRTSGLPEKVVCRVWFAAERHPIELMVRTDQAGFLQLREALAPPFVPRSRLVKCGASVE